MDRPRVVVVGATGAVGQTALRVLEERDFPMGALRVCASPRSYGKRLAFRDTEVIVEEATERLFSECDIAFISVSAALSRQLAPIAVRQGCVVIDDSSAFRMDSTVPLVVPEVNGDDIDSHQGILAIPNCSTTPVVMALQPLHAVDPVQRLVVDTYQSVSGSGAAAVAELWAQTGQLLRGEPTHATQYPHQIAFNVLPHIEPFEPNGYTREEMKVQNETRKILHAPHIAVSATCVRVPVSTSHSAAVHVELQYPMPIAEARERIAGFPGVVVLDDPAQGLYPMPINASGKDEVFVGRIRQDLSHASGLAMWITTDNLRKGAATNAIQIAEELVRRGALLRQGV